MLHSSYQPKSQQPGRSRFSRFAVASVLLLLVCLRPAQAQWSVTYLCNGSSSTGSYQQPWPSTPVADTGHGVSFSNGPGSSPNTVTGKITPVFTWGGMFGPPPSSLDILVTASANASGYTVNATVNDGSVSASNGLGNDPTGDGTTKSGSAGSHLFHLDNKQLAKVLTFPAISLNAIASSSGRTYCTVSLQAVQDTREVTISCPEVDTSQYRDPPLTGPVIVNARQSDGTMRGDTVRPHEQTIGGARDETLTYTASVLGTWGSDSSYLWNNQYGGPVEPGDNTDSGVFGTVPDHSVDYSATIWDYHGDPTVTDHIYLHLTDSNGGANATSNYYMHFHETYEPKAWPPDGPAYTVSVIPDPEVPTWPTYPWELPNPAVPLYYNDTAGDDVTIAPAGFKDVDGGLDLGADPVVANFGFSYQLEDEVTVTKHLTATPPVPLGFQEWPVYRPQVNRTKGHLDQYGLHGYVVSRNVWRKDEKAGWQIRLYDPQPLNAAVTAPPPNWNPQ